MSARSRLFPGWVVAAGGVLALVAAVGACTIAIDADAVQAVAGLAILLGSAWILVLSVLLWRRSGDGTA